MRVGSYKKLDPFFSVGPSKKTAATKKESKEPPSGPTQHIVIINIPCLNFATPHTMHGRVAVSQIRGWDVFEKLASEIIAICSSRRHVHSLCRLSVCRTEVCVETTSVVDTHELLSFEDRELPYREGVWAASRLRGFINISDRSELPRHMQKWHWSWVKVGLAREVSDWSGVSYMSDPAHRHLGRSLVFRSLKCLVVPRSANKSAGNLEVRLPEPNARHERNPSQRLVGLLGDQ